MSRRNTIAVWLGVAAVATLLASLAAGGAGASPQSSLALPRTQTLYVSGTAWGPYTNFNPLRGGYATGVVGLLYETLFRYDPLKDKFIPWLATKRGWQGNTYVVTLRNGVTWNDGKPLTAADVKFTFETGKLAGSQYSTMWKTGLQRVAAAGNTVRFVFRGTPNYQEWDSNMYSIPIVPGTSGRATPRRTSSAATPTTRRRWSARGRSSTEPAREAPRRSSGTGVTAGGRTRPSARR